MSRSLDEAAVILNEEDGAFVSSLPPAELADKLGYGRADAQVTPALLKWASGQVETTRVEIRAAAEMIADEHRAKLDRFDAGRGQVRRPTKKIYDRVSRRWRSADSLGLYDWLENLSTAEKARLRRQWFAEPGNTDARSVDEVEDAGLPIEEWVTETRIIDAASALSHGRFVNPDAHGGLDVTQMIESPYDLDRIFGTKEQAAQEIAKVEAASTEDEAWQALPKCHGGPAPWEMTEAAYIAEAEVVEERVRNMVPIDDDEDWGAVYSSEDNMVFDRYRELVPSGIDDPDKPRNFSELYRAILKLAREGGRI